MTFFGGPKIIPSFQKKITETQALDPMLTASTKLYYHSMLKNRGVIDPAFLFMTYDSNFLGAFAMDHPVHSATAPNLVKFS